MRGNLGKFILLWILGAISLLVFTAIVELRLAAPLAGQQGGSMTDMPPARVAIQGAISALSLAEEAWRNDRHSEMMHALDASIRIVEVAGHATRPAAPLKDSQKILEELLHTLRNGNQQFVGEAVEKAKASLQSVSRDISAAGSSEFSGYGGATLIDRSGIRIGEVVSVNADNSQATLVVGGVRDALGFLDFGGQEITVPSGELLFGKRKGLGPTLVAWPHAPRH